MGFTPRVDTPCPQAWTAGTAMRPIQARLVNPLLIPLSICGADLQVCASAADALPPIILMAMNPPLLRPLVFLFAMGCFAGDPQLSRPVRAWEFVDATGPRAGLLGTEDGTLEAYVYPLKIFGDLKLRFVTDAQIISGESLARRISSRPGSYTITYAGDDFQADETLVVPTDEPGAVILLDVRARSPLRIDVEFVRDFQLMWPASIGTGYAEWNDRLKRFQFGADGQPFAAVFGSPDAALESREYATNYAAATHAVFTLGEIKGHVQRVLALAASMKSSDEALAASMWSSCGTS